MKLARPEVVNIVAVAILDGPLDLKALGAALPGTEFGPRSPWLKYNVVGEGYVAFYKSGKFLVTGVRTDAAVKRRVSDVSRLLASAGMKRRVIETNVQNVVVMTEMQLVRGLEHIQAALPHLDITYEPEQFPGLMVRGKVATFLLFASGKWVCTGTKSAKVAEGEIDWLNQELAAAGCLD